MFRNLLILGLLSLNITFGATAPWQGVGRIALSSDGNDHDDDDWAATPMSLALLSAKGLQDKMVLYTYSDHVWGNNKKMNSYEQMQESALKGAEYFGFDKNRFVCAVDNPKKAYEAMRDEINKSSPENPLFIIGAGPMQVIGEAINLSDKDKLKYVSVISHSEWNNNHGKKHKGWTLDMIEKNFKQHSLNIIRISDQNGGRYKQKVDYEGMFADKDRFEWLKNSPAKSKAPYKEGSWEWLYTRLESCERAPNEKKKWLKASFDASDSGMLLYLLTGIEATNVDMAKEIMEHPVLLNLLKIAKTKYSYGDYDGAKRILKEALKLAPKNVEAINLLKELESKPNLSNAKTMGYYMDENGCQLKAFDAQGKEIKNTQK